MLLDFNRRLIGHTPEQCQTHRGMAHFAGTGPAGETCGGCSFYANLTARTLICGKARQLGAYSKQHIPADAAACKYFEKKAVAS